MLHFGASKPGVNGGAGPLGSPGSATALYVLDRGIHVTCSLKFTSGVTPANFLVVSMATIQISSTYLQGGTGGAQNLEISCHRECSTD